METLIADLRIAAKNLNDASDRLSVEMEVLNDRLKSLALGVSAWVSFKADGPNTVQVGYTKINKKWGIVIREVFNGTPGNAWPFNEAPRHYRVLCAPKLLNLMDEIVRVAGGMIEDLNEAATTVDAYVQVMKTSTDAL